MEQTALAVERFACPTCATPAGSPCRTRSGNVAVSYHTTRFILVPALGEVAEVRTPADRGAGQAWTPMRAPVPVRIGYAYAPDASTDISDHLSDLEVDAGCARTFLDVVGPMVKARPELNRAIELAAEQRHCAENQPVVFTVYDLADLARNAAELIDVSRALRAADVHLELRTGQLAGVHDPNGVGSTFFTVLDAAGELEHRDRRQRIEAGQKAAGDRGRHAGRPKVFDDAMLSQARTLRAEGVPVPEIASRLTISTGKNAGRHPSLASVYRALSEVDPTADVQLREGLS
ncbi:DNA invertase Pin-like site-specific DNA recombinase [Catenulispora sp. GP43]|uniref:recombinase family protein n=1 Tax=Catenulispora sp. GP43 TaxID=3156263 RepID=UPI0035140DF1